jgi:hypothetical protein
MDPERLAYLSGLEFLDVERGGHLWVTDGVEGYCLICAVIISTDDENKPCHKARIAELESER